MREVRVEERAQARPRKHLCSFKAAGRTGANFPLSHANRLAVAFRSFGCLSADHRFLSFSLSRNFSRNPSAASVVMPCVSCDELLMCAEDLKKENTMHHHIINSARKSVAMLSVHWQPAVLSVAGICVFILWFIGTMKVGVPPTLNDGRSCLALKKWHKRLENYLMTWPLLLFILRNIIEMYVLGTEILLFPNFKQPQLSRENSTGRSSAHLSDLSAQHQIQHENASRIQRMVPLGPTKH